MVLKTLSNNVISSAIMEKSKNLDKLKQYMIDFNQTNKKQQMYNLNKNLTQHCQSIPVLDDLAHEILCSCLLIPTKADVIAALASH